MNLQWLDDFRSLAETGSYSRSAELRHTTQSALSRRIQALEAWVGARLVDRSTYPVRLTGAGVVFREVAADISERLAGGRTRALAAGGGPDSPIEFAATHSMAFAIFPAWVATIEAALGPIAVRLECRSAEQCLQAAEVGQAHFAICPMPDRPLSRIAVAERLLSVVIGRDEMIPVSAPGPDGEPLHALPGSKARPTPLVALSDGALLGGALKRLLAERAPPAQLKAVFESPLKDVLRGMALNGRGLAWLPRRLIARDLADGRLVLAGDASWNVPFQVRLHRAPGPLPDHAERLWRHLLAAGRTVAA